jgi:hypothetical protein
MKKKLDYKEQLKSPKWQKKRLDIMQRDNFTCQICGTTEKQLHVHHLKYEPGCNIWEYFDSHLITLCDDCHRKEHGHGFEDHSIENALYELRQSGYTNFEISSLLIQLIDGNDSLLLQLAKDYKECGLVEEHDSIMRLSKRRERIRDYIDQLNTNYLSEKYVKD